MDDREKQVLAAAVELHKRWMTLVNFRHPGSLSSSHPEATAAKQAWREVRDAYDDAFGRFTVACELLRQGR